jgi:EAL domain-containing protein (putative c-di-GMP-specific phosphodiesterase class I)
VGEALAKDLAWTSEALESQPKVNRWGHEAATADGQVPVVPRREEEADLARALRTGELEVHYQPVVSLRSDRIIGVEALVRWRHPQRGLVLPMDFIPLAEETDLIIPLGRWVLGESCRQAREWQERYPSLSNLEMCVNLSARQLRHRGLVGDVAEALEISGLRSSCLVLEMTESIMMEDVEAATETLRELKGLGVRIAIDDFGTGYSSLSYLRRFPVDVLKMDRSFLSDLGHELEDVTVVSAVIKLAKAMGLEVVAEGIEKTAQLTQLRGLDCEFAQGFLFARPLPHEAVSALLARVGEA